uniref:Ubiquitin-like domain-containing protein n=1 Tax=Acrobeloides nanus TaxID=290746 RepID=A0A914BYL2_9BILA
MSETDEQTRESPENQNNEKENRIVTPDGQNERQKRRESTNEPNLEDENAHVRFKCVNQEGASVHFRVKRNTKFEKIMKAYADRMLQDVSILRFLIDGRRIGSDETPHSIGLEDDAYIEIHREMFGGAKACF